MSFFENYEDKTKNLSREERVNLRNDIVMMDIYTGVSKGKVAEKFRISVRTVERILEKIDEDSQEWYKLLPKKYAMAIHRRNSNKVFNEITKLTSIRATMNDNEKEFYMTQGIIDSYIKYDKMLSEGPTLQRQKDLTEEMEKILEDGTT